MNYLFTSESVSEGHPDKVADQISDAILDKLLAYDPASRVACETLVTTGQVVIAGEIASEAYIDIPETARKIIREIGYNNSELKFDGESCGVLLAVHEQSGDIARGVVRDDDENQGAGDQGMMVGYACSETPMYIPLTLALSHAIVKELAEIRREGIDMTYLRPDSKSQVTVEYDGNNNPLRVDTIVVSTQHDEFIRPTAENGLTQEQADSRMLEIIRRDVEQILLPRVRAKLPENLRQMLDGKFTLHVNPTGKFVIGGPHGDTGLTGRKIIVDTYGGRGAHGGGAFSGKDPSKVDRSAAYAARYIAKNLVAAGVAREALVQLAYAIGVADPVSVNIDTKGTANVPLTDEDISRKVVESGLFPLRPAAIIRELGLRNPIYTETAAYGHVGRTPRTVVKKFTSPYNGDKSIEVRLFTWEETDKVPALRKLFFNE
ncbi:MAG: methionine adenosyltransferase [Muribaculaceae bacterium]|nr:methionine adenosyltransferase [Muribaculaceae bacterium]